jgi:hypothetical protein
MFNLDVMTMTSLLVLAANLALILLVGNLALEKAREAWDSVSGRARQTRTQIDYYKTAAEAASIKTSEAVQGIRDAERKLADAEKELAAVKQRQETEPLPFVYSAAPTDSFDAGGSIWEFIVHNEAEAQQEIDPDHHARHWSVGRLYVVQAATQAAARRQLERHLPGADGFRVTVVRRIGDNLFAEAS